MSSSDSSIVRSAWENIQTVNDIIAAANSHWKYPITYLKPALELLKIDRKYLEENICFDIFKDGEVVGFASLAEKDGDRFLDHLWIHPKCHRSGLGRLACERIFDIARDHKCSTLFVLPDAPAADFYKKVTFFDTSIDRVGNSWRFGFRSCNTSKSLA
jgi:N-acetylglutamate synthase-like GNAT family acetyltransferase